MSTLAHRMLGSGFVLAWLIAATSVAAEPARPDLDADTEVAAIERLLARGGDAEALPRVEAGWISGRLKSDVRLSPEYVMNFTGDLRADALGRFRRASLEFADRLLDSRGPQDAEKLALLEREIAAASSFAR